MQATMYQAAPLPSPRPSPPSSSWALLALVLALASSSARAQAGVCKAGANCDVQKLTSRGTTSLNNSCIVSDTLNRLQCGTTMSTNQNFSSGTNSQLNWSTGFVYVGDGTAAVPQFGFQSDTNTGLYRPAADSIGFAINGLRSFVISNSTVGVFEGETSSQVLTLNNATGARLGGGGATITAGSGPSITLNAGSGYTNLDNTSLRRNDTNPLSFDDADGYLMVGVAVTSLPTAAAKLIQTDSTLGHVWHTESATAASTPWVDVGGARHPVMEERTFGFYVGQESTATPTFDVAPRVGGSTVSWTIVDGAAASSVVGGSAPFVRDLRGSVTTATAAPGAGSTSTAINSAAWIRRDHGPRWCQWVSASAKTSVRLWAGMTPSLPVNTDTLANDSIAFRSSSAAGDGNWNICSKDGATQSCTDTGVSVGTGTPGTPQLLCIDCRESGACTAWVDGVARVRKTTNLPTVTTKLSAFWVVEALSASARTFYAGHGAVETH